jgi:hypothetical protein
MLQNNAMRMGTYDSVDRRLLGYSLERLVQTLVYVSRIQLDMKTVVKVKLWNTKNSFVARCNATSSSSLANADCH